MAASGSAQVKRGYYLDSISAFDLWHLFAAARERGREQWWQPERIAETRARRLQRLAEAAAHTPRYRELFQRAGLQPGHLKSSFRSRPPARPAPRCRCFATHTIKQKFRHSGPASLRRTAIDSGTASSTSTPVAPCSKGSGCGRGLGLLSAVQGRTRHVIRMPDGRVLHFQTIVPYEADSPVTTSPTSGSS
jgi:hypothetical protein